MQQRNAKQERKNSNKMRKDLINSARKMEVFFKEKKVNSKIQVLIHNKLKNMNENFKEMFFEDLNTFIKEY